MWVVPAGARRYCAPVGAHGLLYGGVTRRRATVERVGEFVGRKQGGVAVFRTP